MKFNRIKTLVLVCTLFVVAIANIEAQDRITVSQWQEDLRYLQQTIHSDYPFLFKKVTPEAFDAAVDEFYTQIPDLQTHEIKVGFSRMVALFKYGHTLVPFSTLAKEHVLPINLYQFSDGVFVEGAHKRYAAIVGAKVIAIAGVPIDQALKMIRPVVPEENPFYFKAYGIRYVTAPAILHAQGVISKFSTKVALTLEKGGKTIEQIFEAVPLQEIPDSYGFTRITENWIHARNQDTTPLYIKYLNEKVYYFEYLKDKKVVYARQSQVMNDEAEGAETLDEFYTRLFAFIEANDVEKLIFDVRLNGGGNNFLVKPLITGAIETKKINQKGKFFVIIGRRTFSACQNMVNRLDLYTNALFVGEPTGENVNFYGDNRRVTLPNSLLNTYISWAWWQDKAPWNNAAGLIPDVPTELRFEEYRTNQDPAVEAALNYTVDGDMVEPMEHLTKLFLDKNFEQFEKDARMIVNDKRYASFDVGREMSRIAKMLADQQNLPGAQFLYELNTRLFVDTAAVWIDLATFMITTKNDKAAKAYLKKAKRLETTKEQATQIKDLLKGLK